MSTPSLDQALSGIPARLRASVLSAHRKAVQNYSEGRWGSSELNGGKLCEATYRIIEWHITGNYTRLGDSIPNFERGCQGFAQADKAEFPQSVRLTIPRVLIALYDVRNKRGVGHLGGDVDENHMDAELVLALSNWLVAELVRVFYSTTPEEAAALVDGVVEKRIPLVWDLGSRRRVLNPKMSARDKTLVLLYHSYPKACFEADLVRDTGHSNASVYRRDVLRQLHKDALVDYDDVERRALISPLGRRHVETNIQLAL